MNKSPRHGIIAGPSGHSYFHWVGYSQTECECGETFIDRRGLILHAKRIREARTFGAALRLVAFAAAVIARDLVEGCATPDEYIAQRDVVADFMMDLGLDGAAAPELAARILRNV